MKKGFTLIELLIASSLGVAVLSAALLSGMSLIRSYSAIERALEASSSARISLFRITTDARNALEIKTASGADKLILDMGGKEVSYDLNLEKVRRSVDGTASYLTEQGRVKSLKFSYLSPKLVRISIGFGEKALTLFTSEAYVRN